MTKAEVARLLRVTPRTVRRWAKDGLIHQVVLGTGTVRYTTESILTFIAAANEAQLGATPSSMQGCPPA